MQTVKQSVNMLNATHFNHVSGTAPSELVDRSLSTFRLEVTSPRGSGCNDKTRCYVDLFHENKLQQQLNGPNNSRKQTQRERHPGSTELYHGGTSRRGSILCHESTDRLSWDNSVTRIHFNFSHTFPPCFTTTGPLFFFPPTVRAQTSAMTPS